MSPTLDQIKLKATPVLKNAGVSRAALFGSYVRGENTSASDIDMLVDVPAGTTLFDLVELQLSLENSLGKKVDLVTYKSIYPALKDRIMSERVPIYE